MQTKLMTIFTRTPLHVGAGASVGAVDQPVIRERHTRFPVIPGSSIKGVLADLFTEREQAMDNGKPRLDKDMNPVMVRIGTGKELFGSNDPQNAKAGDLLVGEAKLLVFPVRSAKGCFAWITCPLALTRFLRDSGLAFKIPDVAEEKALVTTEKTIVFKNENKVIFEEYPFSISLMDPAIVDALTPLCNDNVWQNEIKTKLAIVTDELFSYFAENACEIAQHNRIEDSSGVVAPSALFNQENVPSETLFYTVVSAKDNTSLPKLEAKIAEQGNLLQIGGDSTTGLGWCSITVKKEAK